MRPSNARFPVFKNGHHQKRLRQRLAMPEQIRMWQLIFLTGQAE
jgi:hypothetical protein